MNWRLWVSILILCIVGVLSGIPLTLSIIKDPVYSSSLDLLDVFQRAVKEFLFILLPASLTGVLLSKKTGLSFNFSAQINAENKKRNVQLIIFSVFFAGIILAIPGIIGFFILPEGALGAGQNNPTPIEWLLRSISAAITEEIAFRFGLMTLVTWILLSVKKEATFYNTALWTGNATAAFVFAAAHLPSIVSSDPLNWGVISSVILFNSGAGVALGWLYMRYGLLSAMLCHFIADFFQHVMPRII